MAGWATARLRGRWGIRPHNRLAGTRLHSIDFRDLVLILPRPTAGNRRPEVVLGIWLKDAGALAGRPRCPDERRSAWPDSRRTLAARLAERSGTATRGMKTSPPLRSFDKPRNCKEFLLPRKERLAAVEAASRRFFQSAGCRFYGFRIGSRC